MPNQRTKGAAGEREAAKIISEILGVSAIRGQQRSGIEQADVVGVSENFHIEVKRRKRLAFWEFVKQARRDRKAHQIPIVMFRPDGDTDWHVAFSVSHMIAFAREIIRIVEERNGNSSSGSESKPVEPRASTSSSRRVGTNSDNSDHRTGTLDASGPAPI